MRRLYLQVYLAFLGILGLFGVLMGAAWALAPPSFPDQRMLEGVAAVVGEVLAADKTPPELERSLRRLAAPLGVSLTLWSAEGEALAWVGERLPFPGKKRARSGWMRGRGGPLGALRLPDGRWLVARHGHGRPPHAVGLLVVMGLLALAVAVGAYPLARRLTRRLERLRAGVEKLGGGDLAARVPVEGKDEVAALAASFNGAADRIEKLVGAQRAMLAGASHELRSPLARIRVALELLAEGREDLRERVARDVTELDELIGELLLASRLQAAEPLARTEEVDLLALLAEEASQTEAEVGGHAVPVRGDARMLRRLVRNLLDNARRHGAAPVEAWAGGGAAGRAILRVCDRGRGVPQEERERIFLPFHQMKGGEGGVGLGLALVRQIAQHHGGDVRCVPREGGGTCFEVELPLEPKR